jgi:hypothetical protein
MEFIVSELWQQDYDKTFSLIAQMKQISMELADNRIQ